MNGSKAAIVFRGKFPFPADPPPQVRLRSPEVRRFPGVK